MCFLPRVSIVIGFVILTCEGTETACLRHVEGGMAGCGLVVGREMESEEKQGEAIRFEILLIYRWAQGVAEFSVVKREIYLSLCTQKLM